MSTGSISLDILLNKILTDAISGGNESIRAIQKRYPSLLSIVPILQMMPNLIHQKILQTIRKNFMRLV